MTATKVETEEDYWLRFWDGMMTKYDYAVTGFSDDPSLDIVESGGGWHFDEPVTLAGVRDAWEYWETADA